MYTLIEYAAEFIVALYNENVFCAVVISGDRRGESRRATASYDYIVILQFVFSVTSFEVFPDFVISSKGIPSSRAKISATSGWQKPP